MTDESPPLYDDRLRMEIAEVLANARRRGMNGVTMLGTIALNVGDLIGSTVLNRQMLTFSLEAFCKILNAHADQTFQRWRRQNPVARRN